MFERNVIATLATIDYHEAAAEVAREYATASSTAADEAARHEAAAEELRDHLIVLAAERGMDIIDLLAHVGA